MCAWWGGITSGWQLGDTGWYFMILWLLVTLYWYHMCMTLDCIYIYIHIRICIYMFMILDGHWQSVCVYVCAWFTIMILVVWITACFFVLTCPRPSRFQVKHDNCVYVCVWFSNHDTCCLNYSMFFCSDLPPPPGFNLSMTTVCMCVCLVQ